MNIGIVTTWYERGASYVSKAYMRALEKEHMIYVYARGGHTYAKGDPEWDLPCVTWAPRLAGIFRRSDAVMSMTNFSQWLRKNAIDIVLFNEQRDIKIVEETSKLGYLVGAYVDYYTDKTIGDFDSYDFLICNTKRHYSIFKNHRNCLFIQWGTDVDIFRPQKDVTRPSNMIIFFHSAGYGGVSLRKGTDLLVKAFKDVRGKVKLIIHSQVPLDTYDSAAKMITGDPRIEFIKKTVPAPGLYHLGDVYVYPSKLEGIGLSIAEALSCGLPVITTDNPPMNEFVQDGHSGLLVKVCRTEKRVDGYFWPENYIDINDLTAKMQLYVNNPQIVDIHGRNARIYAQKSFNWTKNSSALAEWISDLVVCQNTGQVPIRTQLRWYGQDIFLIVQRKVGNITNVILSSLRKLLKIALLR